MDLNRNNVDDVEEIKAASKSIYAKAMDKVKGFFALLKNNKLVVTLCFIILGLSAYTYRLYTNPTYKEKIVYADTPEAMMKSKNIMCVNLEEYKVIKTKKVKSKVSGKDLIGVWYQMEQTSGESTYIAKFETEDNLKNNKGIEVKD